MGVLRFRWRGHLQIRQKAHDLHALLLRVHLQSQQGFQAALRPLQVSLAVLGFSQAPQELPLLCHITLAVSQLDLQNFIMRAPPAALRSR
jgi:hypothetical protein